MPKILTLICRLILFDADKFLITHENPLLHWFIITMFHCIFQSKHFTGTASKTAFVMIRFARSHAEGLQSKLKETKGNLDALGGLIVAFSTNVSILQNQLTVICKTHVECLLIRMKL